MKEPVDHILRPRLPWRDQNEPAITECGYSSASVKTITREQYAARYKELGMQRCAMTTCMTCADTSKRWETWEQDPRQAVGREVEWECNKWRRERSCQLKDELESLADLAANHASEFAELIRKRRERRDWNAKKEAKPAKPATRGRNRL